MMPPKFINNIKSEVAHIPRDDIIKSKHKQGNNSPPLVFSTVFSKHIKGLRKTILKHWQTLMKDDEAKLLFDKHPLFAFRRHRNLKDILTSATLK